MAKKSPEKQLKTDYENIGKMVQSIYESGYLNKNTTYKMSFFKGVFTGLGGVVGATVVLGLLLWALSLFDNFPLIGELTEKFENSVEVKSP